MKIEAATRTGQIQVYGCPIPVAVGLAVAMLPETFALSTAALLAANGAVKSLLLLLLPVLARDVSDQTVLAKAPVASLILASKHARSALHLPGKAREVRVTFMRESDAY
jgi:hypothetical protein